jgi:uncharacterized protein Yka (UPF0111/DUF47 family)
VVHRRQTEKSAAQPARAYPPPEANWCGTLTIGSTGAVSEVPMLKLVPQARFFDLFEKQSELVKKGAAHLHQLIYDFGDARAKAAVIKSIEHDADLVTHEIIQNLNMNFVTPMDREDILTLATRLDDVLDFIEAFAERLALYRIRQPDATCKAFADIIVSIVDQSTKQFIRCEESTRNFPSTL